METVEVDIPRRVEVGEKIRFKSGVPSRLQGLAGKEYTVKRIVRYAETEIWKRKWWRFGHWICITIPDGNQIVELEEIPERSFSTNWFSLPLEKKSVRVVRKKLCDEYIGWVEYIDIEPLFKNSSFFLFSSLG
ncbi:MAG: hypothetical protein V1841_00055 [Patescibacteria group bacterium]